MPSTTLRLYRGDSDLSDAPDEITRDAGATGTATLDRPEAAPRVLPFPGRRDETDETARADRGGVALRFHAAHDEPAEKRDAAAFDAAADPTEWPDVLPLSAILSHPDSGLPTGYRVNPGAGLPGATGDLPEGAVAGRVGFGVSLKARGGWVETAAPAATTPLTRARALHANRTCQRCGAGGVEPVLLADTVRDAAGDVVPGSGTLVGFHCGRCEAQWPVA